MGGSVKDPTAFDPFKAGISSTTGDNALPGNSTNSGLDKTVGVQERINEIRK